ncbi:MAG: hypothetical protein WC989_04710 [Micavibrio sp.]
MGSSADDIISRKKLRRMAGEIFARATDAQTDALMDEAQELCAKDKMGLGAAVKILSGQSRKPYGTPKR